MPQHRWARRVFIALLALAGALVVALVLTGVWLALEYRPDAQGGWTEPELPTAIQAANRVRITHRIVSHLLVSVTFVLLVFVLVARGLRGRWFRAVATWVLALAASFTGYLLAWDQLALWAVTTGTNLRGIRWVFDEDVRFVLLDGVEVGRSTYATWAGVHVLAVPLAAATIVGVAVVNDRRRRINR